MRLKRLTLTGYKTFATKTAFEFGEGITAVIGPNGSGKSNVADSIRWALGEQSFSLLRGKRTDDMIFSGSAKRPRSSMADVLLTFDNSDGFFPVEFSEIEIGRRAYRDGSNEYLLNGNRVRLRDVAELLSHTGLAERTYTVIGQGLVDTALTQKPEERRALFEEAAGVAVYRDKREDALRKLDETQGNLNRARDILAEITPRLAQLERQTTRARQFEVLSRELNGYLATWFAYQYHRLRGQIGHAQRARDDAAAEVGAARAAVEAQDAAIAAIREGQAALRAKIAEVLPRRDEARQARESRVRDLAVLRERAASFIAQTESLRREVEEQSGALKELAGRVAHAAGALVAAQDALAKRQRELESAQVAAADQQTARAALEQRRAEAQRELMRINTAIVSAQNRAKDIRGRQQRLSQQLTELARRAERLNTEREAELSGSVALDAQAQQDAARLQALSLQHDQAGRELETARSALSQAQSDLAAAEAEEKMARRITLFAEMRAQQGADDLVAQAQKAGLPGLRGTLASHVQIHADDQKAVEAAFGDALGALVIEPSDALTRARAWLATLSSAGRLIAAPLSDVSRRAEARADQDGALSAIARQRHARPVLDVVTAPDWLRPVLRAIAGRAFIARDLEAARALAAELGEGCVCVTRDGEIALANGVLVLRAGERRPIIIGEPTDAAEDPAALTMITPEEARANVARAQTARREAQTALDAARRKLDDAARVRDAHNRDIAARRARRDDLDRRIARFEDQLAQTAGEIASVEGELTHLAEQLTQLDAAIAQDRRAQIESEDGVTGLDAQLREQLKIALQPSLFEASSAVNEAGLAGAGWMGQLNAASSAVATAAEAARSAENLHRERLRALDDAHARRAARERRLAELTQQQASSSAQLEAIAAHVREAEAAVAEHDGVLAPLQRDLGDADRRVLAAEEARRDRDRSLRESDSRLSGLELELLRHQDEMISLRQRAEESLRVGDADARPADDAAAPQATAAPLALETLPEVDAMPDGMDERITTLRNQIRRLGAINFEAATEFEELSKRHVFLTEQVADLEKAGESLKHVILELNEVMKVTFRQTFDAIAGAFAQTFKTLFGGGQARLSLVNADNIDEAGVEISAQPPGKRPQTLALLSGGERSLTAAALLFAILRVKPTPLCVLDEVDAALDEANIGRFRAMLQAMSEHTQFIIITHNRGTVEAANTIYGISMGPDGASAMLSLRLEDVAETR